MPCRALQGGGRLLHFSSMLTARPRARSQQDIRGQGGALREHAAYSQAAFCSSRTEMQMHLPCLVRAMTNVKVREGVEPVLALDVAAAPHCLT